MCISGLFIQRLHTSMFLTFFTLLSMIFTSMVFIQPVV